jgi:hypothetical protein
VTSKTVPSYGIFFQEIMIITIIGAANKKLQQIQNGSPREWILIPTALISQVRIAFVVEHLIGGQIHAGMEYLQLRHYNGNEHVKQMTKNGNENSHEIKYHLHYFIMFGCGL